MDLIKEHNLRYAFFSDITGEAMRVHSRYKPGLLESAYEAALKYLLTLKGYNVKRQVYVPIFWEEVELDQSYRLDLLINDEIILELKSCSFISNEHRFQLWNYMRLTHKRYGMLINFGSSSLYSEWYEYDVSSNEVNRVRLM